MFDTKMISTFYIMLIFIGLYFAAATAGFVRSGAAASFRLLPPDGVSALRSLSMSDRLLIAFNISMLAVGFFFLASPLFALSFFNALTGRQPPHGALAQWFLRLAERRRNRPSSCPWR